MDEDVPLDRLQRWFQAVITHPLGVSRGLASEGARSQIELESGDCDSLVTRSERLGAVDRMNVYANAYAARLLECLQSDYPALRHAVGDEIFMQFVLEYLQAHPSQSYTLSDLGRRFPAFLEATQPPEVDSEAPTWQAFLIDLARLERAYAEVFDGPGMENEKVLGTDELLRVPADRWADAIISVSEGMRLEAYRFPVHAYCSAVRRGERPEFPEPSRTLLAIYRSDYVVRRLVLNAPQHRLLEAIVRGKTLAEGISAALEADGESEDDVVPRLRDWFAEWTSLGFFRGVRTAPVEDADANR